MIDDAIESNPTFSDAYFLRANYTFFHGAKDAQELREAARLALKDYEKAMELEPNIINVYLASALVSSAINEVEKALEYLERAEEIMPGDPTLKLYIARVYHDAGQSEKAMEYLRSAESMADSRQQFPFMDHYFYRQAELKLEMGLTDEAAKDFDRWFAMIPDEDRDYARKALARAGIRR